MPSVASSDLVTSSWAIDSSKNDEARSTSSERFKRRLARPNAMVGPSASRVASSAVVASSSAAGTTRLTMPKM